MTSLLVGHTHRPQLFYPTADNDGWMRPVSQISSPALPWKPQTTEGDINFSEGDRAYGRLGLLARQGSTATIIDFGNPVPGDVTDYGNGYAIDPTAAAPTTMTILQTADSESPAPLLDAVMLVPNPAQWVFPVPSNPNGGPILIRNRQFAQFPNINSVASSGNVNNGTPIWKAERTDLPAGTTRFWASGGHTSPTYFAYVAASGAVFRTTSSGWQQLTIGATVPSNWGGSYGPLFVNPYDPTRVVVATQSGILVSHADVSGNLVFVFDEVITALLTNGQEYPRTTGYGGADEESEPQGMGSHANAMGYLSQVAFGPEGNHHEVVAASPFTGAFYAADDTRAWRSLSYVLPRPVTAVSDAAIDYDGVTLSTEGRSLLKVHDEKKAKVATFYRMAPPQSRIAALYSGYELPLINEPVQVLVRGDNGATLASATETTDFEGGIAFPPGVPQGTDVIVQLDFAGDANYAPSETIFELSAPSQTPLTVTVTTVGSGSVVGGPINCGSTCVGHFAIGGMVTLQAKPAAGWTFSSWSGACTGTSTACTLTVEQSESVTATFTQQAAGNHKLTVNMIAESDCATSLGTVTSMPAGINCQLNAVNTTCVANFSPGTAVSLAAVPGNITNFTGYSGDCTGSATSCSLTMNADKTVNATFCGLIP